MEELNSQPGMGRQSRAQPPKTVSPLGMECRMEAMISKPRASTACWTLEALGSVKRHSSPDAPPIGQSQLEACSLESLGTSLG